MVDTVGEVLVLHMTFIRPHGRQAKRFRAQLSISDADTSVELPTD